MAFEKDYQLQLKMPQYLKQILNETEIGADHMRDIPAHIYASDHFLEQA